MKNYLVINVVSSLVLASIFSWLWADAGIGCLAGLGFYGYLKLTDEIRELKKKA